MWQHFWFESVPAWDWCRIAATVAVGGAWETAPAPTRPGCPPANALPVVIAHQLFKGCEGIELGRIALPGNQVLRSHSYHTHTHRARAGGGGVQHANGQGRGWRTGKATWSWPHSVTVLGLGTCRRQDGELGQEGREHVCGSVVGWRAAAGQEGAGLWGSCGTCASRALPGAPAGVR